MKIERFKQWFQVRDNGYTVAQFLKESDAKAFILGSTQLPCADLHLGNEGVSNKRGYSTRRISIYP